MNATQSVVVLAGIVILTVGIVLAFAEDQRQNRIRRAARDRRAKVARMAAAFTDVRVGMMAMREPMERMSAMLQRVGDAFHATHRTAARPAHRMPRGERA